MESKACINMQLLFSLQGVSKVFLASPFSRQKVTALQNLSLEILEGESFGILGETGSGKTTLARILSGLISPSSGKVLFRGQPLSDWLKSHRFRQQVQMVLQDPFSSLPPGMRVKELLLEPLWYLKREKNMQKVLRSLTQVGLTKDVLEKYPFELSGGQRQRVAIARALIVEPKVLIADEPVSMLDMSLRASILYLLKNLKEKFGLTLIVIAHDISIFPFLCTELAVLYRGQLVEKGKTKELIQEPLHPYTEALFQAVPRMEDDYFEHVPYTPGEDAPSPCPYYRLCAIREERCKNQVSYYRKEDHYLYCPPRGESKGFKEAFHP